MKINNRDARGKVRVHSQDASENGDKRSPNYGFFGKRCTSMANHYLRKSGIKLAGWNFIQRKANTLFPRAYYKRMVRLGFTPIKVVP